ncbi:hypothetical protein [Bifidobacterium jacchi]|uniref:Uncharacterized protein n=1 Tax=Bifidobacterium jacchi TaxID=2490545 RepID=A0A5N5REF6_9BIFI|nr:hypothetical protein [Bifidobacterium jacchi]KAB5605647.1 hypothetical protein EHS19_08860 [Bifidobacterium jacchi]
MSASVSLPRRFPAIPAAYKTAVAIIVAIAWEALLAYWKYSYIPYGIESVIREFPETAFLREPSRFWSFTAISCVQTVILISVVVLFLRRMPRARLVCELLRIALMIAFTLICAISDIVVCGYGYQTPGFVYGLMLLSIFGVAVIVVYIRNIVRIVRHTTAL